MLGGLQNTKSSYKPLSMGFKWRKTTHCNMRCVDGQTDRQVKGASKSWEPWSCCSQVRLLGWELSWTRGFAQTQGQTWGRRTSPTQGMLIKDQNKGAHSFFAGLSSSDFKDRTNPCRKDKLRCKKKEETAAVLRFCRLHNVAHLACNVPGLNPQHSKPQTLTAQKGCLQL